jgi:hypothetical protein
VAALGWILIGAALGLLGRGMAAERLPLGAEGALVGGALGGLLGGASTSLADSRSQYILDPASAAGAAIGATALLFLLYRAGRVTYGHG